MSQLPRPALTTVFVVGLAIPVAILADTGDLGTKIGDEQQCSRIARSLVAGYGFGSGPEQATSIRPPLYPEVLAGHRGGHLRGVVGLQASAHELQQR